MQPVPLSTKHLSSLILHKRHPFNDTSLLLLACISRLRIARAPPGEVFQPAKLSGENPQYQGRILVVIVVISKSVDENVQLEEEQISLCTHRWISFCPCSTGGLCTLLDQVFKGFMC